MQEEPDPLSAPNSQTLPPKGPKARAGPDGALFIESIDASKPLASATSCLEFLLISFCQHFSLKPKQAAGLLTQGGKYLAHIIAKGLRGKYEPVVAWYQAVYSNVKQLMTVVMKEEANGSVNLILSTLRPGFLSKNFETAQWTCRLFSKLGADFLEKDMLPAAWDWFASEGGGIDACITTCKRFGPDIKASAVSVLVQFAHNNFLELFTIQFRNHLAESIHYLTTVNEFLPNLCEIRTSKQELIAAGIVDFWLEFALKEADAEGRKPVDVRLAAISLLCDLWTRFPSKVEEKEEVANNILTAMKRASRDKSRILRHASIGRLFALLDQFSSDRNAYAPIVYKTLTFSLVENYSQDSIREYMLCNFNVTFKESPSIPIGILLDPLLKQMQVSDTSLCNIADFDFFMTVAKHSRLNLKNAIQVLDLLGKLYLNSPGFGRAAGIPFVIICTRFIESVPLQEYLFRFCKYALKLVVDIEKARKAQAQKKLPKYLSNALAIAGLSDELPEEAINGQRRIIIYDMVSRVISMFNPSLNERLKEELIGCDLQIKRETGKHSKGMMTVLSLLGEAGKMLELAEENEPKVAQTDQSEDLYKSPRIQRSLESLTKKSSLKASSKMPKRRVLRDLEKVKQKREEKEMKEILQLELKQKQDEKKGRVLKRQLEQKKIIAGRTPASEKLLFLEGVPDIPQELYYVDLSEESPEDQDGVNVVMKKYSRVLKLLFKKYSSTGHRNKDNKTFDMFAENKSQLSEPELYRLLKDQGVTSAMVTKDAHNAIFKAYCLKNKRGDNSQVDIDGYQGVIIQIALYIFSKPPKDLSIYPPAASVRALFDLFRTASSEKGVSIKFYDEPDPGAGDKDIVKKLNQVLAKDPNAPLPDGYRRVMEKELDVKYMIPQTVRLPDATKVSLSVLDDLLNSLFGVHVLEPQFSFVSIPRARGILAAPALAPSQAGSAQSNSQFQAAPVPQSKPMYNIDPEIKFEMTKLGGRYPVDHVVECGKTLDDLIYSVEMRSAVVISRNKKTAAPIQNQVKLKKEMEIRQEELQKQRAEQRRKLRHQVVEEKLKKAKEEKEAKEREDKDLKKQEQQRKVQRLRKREEDRKHLRDEKEKQLKDWHEKQQEEEKNKSSAETMKKQQEEEHKKKLREEFLAKERKRISELMKGKINERQQTQQRTQEESKRKTEVREQNKQKLMQKIEQDKKKREEDKAQKEQVVRLLGRPDVAQMLQEYGKSIEAVFVHYCKLSTRTDQDPVLAGKALQFAGFNKFSTQFEIYPKLVTPENNLQVFRQLTKDRPATDAVIALSLDEFKQALLKIAVAAQPILQELAGKAVTQVTNLDSFGVDTLQDFLAYLMLTPDVKKTLKLLQGLTTQTSQKKETSGESYIGTPGVSRNLSLKRISHGARLRGAKPGSKTELKTDE